MYGSEVNVILGKFVLSIVLMQHSGYLSDIFAALCPRPKVRTLPTPCLLTCNYEND
jgi:hypothetical protein